MNTQCCSEEQMRWLTCSTWHSKSPWLLVTITPVKHSDWLNSLLESDQRPCLTAYFEQHLLESLSLENIPVFPIPISSPVNNYHFMHTLAWLHNPPSLWEYLPPRFTFLGCLPRPILTHTDYPILYSKPLFQTHTSIMCIILLTLRDLQICLKFIS